MASGYEIYHQLAIALEQGSVVVATVTAVQGSVPREVGAKLLLCADGRQFDTIGGGAGEAKVLQVAQTVLQTGEKQLVTIDLSGLPQRETEGICGGQMQVWVERWQGSAAIALAREIWTRLQAGQSFFLVTPLPATRSPWLSEEQPTNDEPQFCERLTPPPTLLIVGAGHCAVQLAKAADMAGFRVLVQDDRPEWANRAYYPQVQGLYLRALDDVLSDVAKLQEVYVALVTRSYQHDLEALQVLLSQAIAYRYIGMIGSKKRVRQVLGAIAAMGVGGDRLKAIHAPIGLDIGALTPAEIAISITAELIMVRRNGSGKPLSLTF
ncbi:MAG TPA: XdhC family protein [Leptolyngbyaceae cyanobacterium M33_DOE_097]|uniref:Xanthine dehydrogenase n=1 Tax=Oscillatoriales cyanobacterium SpSt-418 TaxID=2282169 RepID=A0A7C3PLH3_9CYAN|nr:XdhC family protein [Leptolyngbyaceae cyanobacterium M33_DOE_097]